MKAGSAGSTPDDAAKIAQASQPLRYFLSDCGDSVASLNTTVIGLDAIENGHNKPDTLDVSWNPIDRFAEARKARRFVLEAVLVRVSEALSQYVGTLTKLPRFERLRDQWTAEAKKERKAIGDARRLSDLSRELFQEECLLTVGACLLIHWRNRAVHRDSNAKLTGTQLRTLQRSSLFIEKEFASLSVDRLLKDFNEGKPTLKDITTLVAMAIRLARKVDGEIRNMSKADIVMLMEYYQLDARIRKIKLETSLEKQSASIKRLLEAEAPGLAEPFRHFFGSDLPSEDAVV